MLDDSVFDPVPKRKRAQILASGQGESDDDDFDPVAAMRASDFEGDSGDSDVADRDSSDNDEPIPQRCSVVPPGYGTEKNRKKAADPSDRCPNKLINYTKLSIDQKSKNRF